MGFAPRVGLQAGHDDVKARIDGTLGALANAIRLSKGWNRHEGRVLTPTIGGAFRAQAEDWGWMKEGVFATGSWEDEPMRDLLIPYAQVRAVLRGGVLMPEQPMSDETREPSVTSRPFGEVLQELGAFQERHARRYSEYSHVVMLGFKKEVDPSVYYPAFEKLGAEVIEERWYETLGQVERKS
jgi:hypothetical protein